MTEERTIPGVDTTRPSIARVYDAMLGGKDNFAVDRAVLDQITRDNSDARNIARANRRWLQRVVRWLAGTAGIDQFLDLGSGLPTAENTHQVVQRLNPDAVVVYVDNDPTVIAHGRVLLDDDRAAFFAAGDLTRPDEVLSDPAVVRHLDLDRPLALLQCSTLHFVPDLDDAVRIMTSYVDRLASGSYVGLTHVMLPGPGHPRHEQYTQGADRYRSGTANLALRTPAEIEQLLPGLELVEPGLVPVDEWWPTGPSLSDVPGPDLFLGGVGRKP